MFNRGHGPTEAIWQREEPVDEAKPFDIPKREVWEAFKRVKANQGAAGVDGQAIAEFGANLSGNLLGDAVGDSWNTQRPRPAVRLRNLDPPRHAESMPTA